MIKKVAGSAATVGIFISGAAAANAFELPAPPALPQEATQQINAWSEQAAALSDQATAASAHVQEQINAYIQQQEVPDPGTHAVDPAPEPAPAHAVESPCSELASACVDLDAAVAWLQDENGNVSYGPVPISSGKPGYETPRGLQVVSRKVKDEWSRPYNAPMPNSVYFGPNGNDNGIAFHEDDPAVASHGCIHLGHQDSEVFFDSLQPGDQVDVF
ncbi:MAG: L,D-transpeptidase [Corynebacterium sp.]|nr:L,D-transpeptidase [Corynebacterium sp.]